LLHRNYYYFIASIPYINYGDTPPFTTEAFIEQCKSFLVERDAALIHYCSYDPKLAVETLEPTGSTFVDFHLLRERTLILNLAKFRADRLKRAHVGEPLYDEPMAKTAFEMVDPLEAELALDRARWAALDEMVNLLNNFEVSHIYAYLLKIQLLERRQHFIAEKGSVEFRKIYDNIFNEFNSTV
jgi:hypothetical protein